MKINSYYSSSGMDLIDKYIQELTLDEQIDAYDVLKQLENGKTETLQIKKWQGKIQEVYFYKHNRIFYVVADQENIYLLHACRKQKNKTEKNDARQIKKRAKELNLTQKQLAELSDCSQQEISRLEKREHSPALRTLCRVVNSMGYELVLRKRM